MNSNIGEAYAASNDEVKRARQPANCCDDARPRLSMVKCPVVRLVVVREPCDRIHCVSLCCAKKPLPSRRKGCALRHAEAVRMRLHNALRHSTPRACSRHVTTRASDDRGLNLPEQPQAYVAQGICVEQLGSAVKFSQRRAMFGMHLIILPVPSS